MRALTRDPASAKAQELAKRGAEIHGARAGAASEHLSGAERAAGLSEAVGEAAFCEPLPVAVFGKLGFPHTEDSGNLFQVCTEFSGQLRRARDTRLSRELNPGMLSFRQWVEQNRGKVSVV